MTKVWGGGGSLIVPRDKEDIPPLVIQLARHCPMILDRPPIHRFNAIDATCVTTPPFVFILF